MNLNVLEFGCVTFVPLFLAILTVHYTSNNLSVFAPIPQAEDASKVLILIPSARGNFKNRQILRNTWLTAVKELENVMYYFTIGDESCPFPEEDRLDIYSCDHWNISLEDIFDEDQSFTSLKERDCHNSIDRIIHQGFDFQVHHPIKVLKLGLLKSSLPIMFEVQVVLFNQFERKIAAEVIFMHNSSFYEKDGYIFLDIVPIILPKGFQGSVVVNGDLFESSNEVMQTVPKIISITKLHGGSGDSSSFIVAPSILFRINEMDYLKTHVQNQNTRQEEYFKEIRKISDQLSAEQRNHDDIMTLGMVDFYRNLPRKNLLAFNRAVNYLKFDFILKTDDDSMIDIKGIVQYIKTLYKSKGIKQSWIGNFRRNWRVNKAGKWADLNYDSLTYPPFACGSGYLVSYENVKWLSNNINDLYSYQGEDTSLGIWLAPIRPSTIHSSHFSCDETCSEWSLSRGQLSAIQLMSSWENYRSCGKICSCS